MKFPPPLLLILIFGLATVGSQAATAYNVGTSGDWNTAATWNPNIAGGPTSGDSINANLASAWSINLGGDRTVTAINNVGTGSGDFLSSVAGVNLLTITGNLQKTFSNSTLSFLDGSAGSIRLYVGGTTSVSLGTLVLSGDNTLVGGTTVSGTGNLHLKSSGALGTSALTLSGGAIDNVSGAALTLSGNNPINLGGNFAFTGSHDLNLGTGAVSLGASRVITLNGSSRTLTFGGALANSVEGDTTLTVNGVGNTVKLGGMITSPGSTSRAIIIDGTGDTVITGAITNGGTATAGKLTKNGSGTLTLMTASSYGGVTTIGGGVLNIRNADALGTTAGGTTVNASGTLQLEGDITTAAEGLSLQGTGASGQTGALVNVSGTNHYTGLLALSNAIGATISSDSGTLNLTNTGTLTGTARPLTFGGSGNGSVASIIGTTTGTVTKTGTGSWTLNGMNTYTGATSVTQGALIIGTTGTVNASSSVSVSAGSAFVYNNTITALTKAVSLAGSGTGAGQRAVLGGSGKIGVAVTLDHLGDVLAPGNSPGVLQFTTGQTWDSFSYDWETKNFTGTTAGTDFDQIAITGSLTLSGTSYQLNLISLTALNANGPVAGFSETNRSWTILTTTGTISGFEKNEWNLVTAQFTSSPAWSGSWSLDLNGTSNGLILTYAVPEPSTALLFAGGLTLVQLRRLRRN